MGFSSYKKMLGFSPGQKKVAVIKRCPRGGVLRLGREKKNVRKHINCRDKNTARL